ncbi:hypothetical protein Tco_1118504 [Tanacetum coccineum]
MVKENMSIEEMRHEQQLVDRKIKEIINDLGYKRFRGEKIDEKYERDCEIRIRKLKQDSNEWSSEVQKKEQAYEEEKYSAAHRYMLSIPFVDEDDYIPLGDIIARYSTSKAITPDLLIEEPDNSLSMGDEHLDTTLSIENLIGPILEEFASELAHIALIPPGIVEADFDPNDDISSDDDDFEDIDRLISNIESLKDNPTPDCVLNSPSLFPIPIADSDSFLEESDAPVIDNFNELNDDQRGSEIDFSQNVEDDDSFTFTIRTFLPFLTYPEVSLLSCSTGSEDTIFDPGIST